MFPCWTLSIRTFPDPIQSMHTTKLALIGELLMYKYACEKVNSNLQNFFWIVSCPFSEFKFCNFVQNIPIFRFTERTKFVYVKLGSRIASVFPLREIILSLMDENPIQPWLRFLSESFPGYLINHDYDRTVNSKIPLWWPVHYHDQDQNKSLWKLMDNVSLPFLLHSTCIAKIIGGQIKSISMEVRLV